MTDTVSLKSLSELIVTEAEFDAFSSAFVALSYRLSELKRDLAEAEVINVRKPGRINVSPFEDAISSAESALQVIGSIQSRFWIAEDA